MPQLQNSGHCELSNTMDWYSCENEQRGENMPQLWTSSGDKPWDKPAVVVWMRMTSLDSYV